MATLSLQQNKKNKITVVSEQLFNFFFEKRVKKYRHYRRQVVVMKMLKKERKKKISKKMCTLLACISYSLPASHTVHNEKIKGNLTFGSSNRHTHTNE